MASRKFVYKSLDQEGLETLQTIAAADRFNRWMFETISAHIKPGGRVLEIGSGIGNISRLFLDAGYEICLSDIRENYCGYLQAELGEEPSLLDIVQLDLVHPTFAREYANWLGHFDYVYALNVVEHIEDDALAMRNAAKLLKPGGTLIILVPAYQALYNQFDVNLHHYRRYTRTSLKGLFDRSGYEIQTSYYFNFIGIFGWFVSGKLLGKKTIPSGQMNLYNRLVPAFRLIDRALFRSMGLSVVVVGQKPV